MLTVHGGGVRDRNRAVAGRTQTRMEGEKRDTFKVTQQYLADGSNAYPGKRSLSLGPFQVHSQSLLGIYAIIA